MTTTVDKSINNYIEWSSQRTTSLDFGPRYDDIMISVEDDLRFFCKFTSPGRHSLVLVMKFHVECNQNHVWGPPGARVMTMFVKTYIFVKVELGHNRG